MLYLQTISAEFITSKTVSYAVDLKTWETIQDFGVGVHYECVGDETKSRYTELMLDDIDFTTDKFGDRHLLNFPELVNEACKEIIHTLYVTDGTHTDACTGDNEEVEMNICEIQGYTETGEEKVPEEEEPVDEEPVDEEPAEEEPADEEPADEEIKTEESESVDDDADDDVDDDEPVDGAEQSPDSDEIPSPWNTEQLPPLSDMTSKQVQTLVDCAKENFPDLLEDASDEEIEEYLSSDLDFKLKVERAYLGIAQFPIEDMEPEQQKIYLELAVQIEPTLNETFKETAKEEGIKSFTTSSKIKIMISYFKENDDLKDYVDQTIWELTQQMEEEAASTEEEAGSTEEEEEEEEEVEEEEEEEEEEEVDLKKRATEESDDEVDEKDEKEEEKEDKNQCGDKLVIKIIKTCPRTAPEGDFDTKMAGALDLETNETYDSENKSGFQEI